MLNMGPECRGELDDIVPDERLWQQPLAVGNRSLLPQQRVLGLTAKQQPGRIAERFPPLPVRSGSIPIEGVKQAYPKLVGVGEMPNGIKNVNPLNISLCSREATCS